MTRHRAAQPAVRGALAGLLAAALAIGVGHLLAAVVGPATSPLFAVGSSLIDAAPQTVKAFAIESFGANDKVALLGAVLTAVLALGALVGLASARRLGIGVVAILAFGLVGTAAALSRPVASPIDALPAIAGAGAALAALGALLRPVRLATHVPLASESPSSAASPRGAGVGPSAAHSAPGAADGSRRRFVAGSVVVAALAAVSGGLGIVVQARARSIRPGVATVIPAPVDPAPTVDPATALDVPGISAFVTVNEAFYRVDTALVPPEVDVASWRLRVHGMVERELSLSYDDLVQLPLIERDITLACVSNPVGGPYVGNARWIGVPLRAVLDEAGVSPAAEQLVSRSVDGMTIGTPVAVALDGRDSLLAIAMNGHPLPVEHGAPVRMIVPGLFGYVSATKWLTELELATWAAYDPYWVQRGWAREGPIRTMSRIDTPRPLAVVRTGAVRVGGVAWAQHRGIRRVEVRVDDGAWAEARLAAVDTIDTWRQWTWDWSATPGRHSVSVRATDGTGAVQPETRADPYPSGATGWHTVVMTAS